MSRCWLREKDGTLLSEVESPSVTGNPKRQKKGVGECRVKIPLGDPCMEDLKQSVPGRPFKTIKDADIELAWWVDGEYGDAAPSSEPWWKGPIVKARHTLGAVEVTAATQEFYLSRSVIGADLVNYTVVPPGDEVAGWFDSDTDLSKWSISAVAASTTTNPDYLYLRPRAALLRQGTMVITTEFPTSPLWLYGFVGTSMMVPTGSSPAHGGLMAQVEVNVDRGAGFEIQSTYNLDLPEDWEYDRHYYQAVEVPLVPSYPTRIGIRLYGGSGGVGCAFGQVDCTRPANAGALAGSDIVQIGAAIADDQTDHLPGTWDYHTTDVGIDLADGVKYLDNDHEDAWSAFNDWSAFFDTYVVDGPSGPRIVCEERGSEITGVTLTGEDLSQWAYEIDSSDAATEVIAQVRPDNGVGPQLQVRVADSDPPNRLVAVESAPEGLSPADLQRWATAVLASRAPAATLEGTNVFYDGTLSDSVLGTWGLGDWLSVNIVDPVDTDVDYTIEPVIDALEWDPVKHTVTPTWVVGGRKRDLPELLAAELRAARRARRKFRPVPQVAQFPLVKQQSWSSEPQLSGDCDLVFQIPAGTWQVNGLHTVTGWVDGSVTAATFDNATANYVGSSSGNDSAVVNGTFVGPRSITVRGRLNGESTPPASRTVTAYATQVAT